MDRTAYHAAQCWRPMGRRLLRHRRPFCGVMVALAARAAPGSGFVNFDVLARHYRWMELVLAGEKLQRCRTAFLGEIPAARNILLLGEGHGRCLVECCRR